MLPVLVWFVVVLLWWLGGSAGAGLGGLTPEPTGLAVLFILCGGMGTGPLGVVGARDSIAFSFGTFDSTVKIKQHCQRK